MTVKINNQNLQAVYNSAQQNFIDGDPIYNAYRFLGKAHSHDGTKEEFITIVSAIINEEPILFGQPKYKIKVKGFGNEHGRGNFLNFYIDSLEFGLSTPDDYGDYQTKFTIDWLKTYWPEFDTYKEAGLLEFVEVEHETQI